MATIDLGKVKLVWRGTYNGSFNYVPDDVVYYVDGSVGSSYICVANTTGNAPSSGGSVHGSWNYLAKGQASSPTTTQGDIIVRGASADGRLAIGAAGEFLKVNSGANGLEYGDTGAWTRVASGNGPGTPATEISIDNIFSDTYYYYKLYYSWAASDWVKARYIKSDGSIESSGVYVGSGQYTKENSAGGPSRVGFTNQNYCFYNYWNGETNAPAICEIFYVNPYASTKETQDFYQAMQVSGTQMFHQSGSNSNMNQYAVRGVQFLSANGDNFTSTNFKYLVLGAKP